MDPFAPADPGIISSQGAAVPHPGMTGGIVGIVIILAIWMVIQHRQMAEETSIPRLGIVFVLLTYLSIWLLERGTRTLQVKYPGNLTDFMAI